jgi:hypothetical protein
MKPVIVNEFGESLSHYPGDKHSKDSDDQKLSTCVGIHSCHGWTDRHDVSPTHMALACRQCGWRVVLPRTIETFADLRAHFHVFNVEGEPGP